MEMISVNLKIGGEAGFGIMASGLLLVKTFSRGNLSAITINDYPSLIRGGHNVILVRVANHEIFATDNHADVLVALNRETIDIHKNEMTENGGVIFDSESFAVVPADFPHPISLFAVPLMRLAKESGGDALMRNTVALGALVGILDYDLEILKSVIKDQFGRKGENIVQTNFKAVEAGYDFVKKTYPDGYVKKMKPSETSAGKQVVLTGNEAIGLGAIASDMKFFAAYPMTPINGLLFYMAGIAEKSGFVYKQPEDEISAINMAIGASFAGVRSMVATSGGGFSLMTEGLSFAGMIEQPIVIIYGQRPGPATGLPTWTTQGDLHFVLNASQGEFPRLVVAPGDIEEAFELTSVAFNLSDMCQTPAFVLVDKYICESYFTLPYSTISQFPITIDRGKLMTREEQEKEDEIKRYLLTDDGISPRPVPGRKRGIFRANSDEHDELGYSIEDGPTTKKMIEKRIKKMESIQKLVPEPHLYGAKDAKHTLVGWGSTKGIMQEVIRQLTINGKNDLVNYLHLSWINPFPSEAVEYILNHAKHVIDIEGNHNAQMADWIQLKTGFIIKDKILKYDGRPFFPSEVREEINKFN